MSNPLRSVLNERRAAPPPEPRVWRDWALLAVVVGAGLLEGLLRQDLPVRVLSIVLCVGLAPALLWRRTHPLGVVAFAFGTVAVVDIGLLLTDGPVIDMYSLVYLLLLPYALFRWGSGREMVAGLAIMAVPATVSLSVSWTGIGDAIGGIAVLVTSMALGLTFRTQHSARQRGLELARTEAKTEERTQLARELHDTVAHHVSAIAIQAQAGRALAGTSPDAPVEALAVIEAEASRTLAEMRTMVRMLRNREPVDYAPQPGVADLARLAEVSPNGLRVAVTLTGELSALPAAVDTATFRIAREAVTNALRHARNATLVDVRVEGNATTVHLNVRDDGEPTPRRVDGVPGYGLTGMAERAALVGGTCSAGPRAGRGWAVDAMLPLEGVR